ncbi:hypothetical protein [Clostridium sp.]
MIKIKVLNKEYDEFIYVKTKPLILDLIKDCINGKHKKSKKE